MVFRDLSRDILGSQDLKIVRDVFERVSSEPWFTAHAEKRDEFARYVVRMYRKGVVIPDKLEALCLTAAKERFSNKAVGGCRFLIVEDEEIIAVDAADTLARMGAEIVGPVSTVKDAFEAIEGAGASLDAALLDINLRGQTIFPVAAFLKMKHIPFAFVTGYDDRSVPAFFRSTPIFTKPANWEVIASRLAQS